MIEEISSESPAVASATPKVHRIGLYNRLAIMISGGLIALCLLIGWALWLLVFRNEINYYIDTFNSSAPNGLQMSFEELSIIIFAVSALAMVLVVVPFIFIRTKNSTSALFSFISFVFATLLVVGFTVFVVIRFNAIKSLVQNDAGVASNTIGIAVVAFLPWALSALGGVFLLGNSVWLLINVGSKYRSNALLVPAIAPEKPEPVVDPIPIPQEENEIAIPLVTTQPEAVIPITTPTSQQPINITVTNNAAFPNQQPNIQQHQDGLETAPNSPPNMENGAHAQTITAPTYTRTDVETSPNMGAYVSEAVAANQNLENNNENNTVKLADPMLESTEPEVAFSPSTSDSTIYSRTNNDIPTASSSLSKYDDLPDESNNSPVTQPNVLNSAPTTSVVTSYAPQNQGGFDVQGATQGLPDESEFRQEKPTVTDYEYKTQQNPAMKPTTKPHVSKPKSAPKVTNNHWTLDQIQTVWEKAETIEGVSDKLYRKDYAGAWMFRDSFTNDLSEANNEKTYSWTIVLHRPVSQSGTTELYNLDPMNIVNAKNKGENYPRWTTKLSSKGNENIVKMQNWKART